MLYYTSIVSNFPWALASGFKDFDKVITSIPILILLVLSYFIPWIISKSRNHHNTLAIFWLNFLLDWTFIGWVASLVWALTSLSKNSDK